MNFRIQRHHLAALPARLILFSALWWAVTEAATGSWAIGVPVVAAATATSLACLPPTTLAWSKLLRFVPFFVARSLLGGIDVARCALHPRLPIAPVVVHYDLHLPVGLPRVVMANMVSLLPGTLSVDLTHDRLSAHVLDARKDYHAEFATLEQRVARLFAVSPTMQQGGN